jgi:hypothetical protein
MQVDRGSITSLFGTDNEGTYVGQQGAYILRFITNANERMRITSGGNVGIGTTSPTSLLHLLGGILKVEAASSSSAYLQLSYNGATNAQSGYIGYEPSANMTLFTNNTERMRITSGGYVGINEQAPNSYLHVKGSLRLPIAIKTATYTLTADDYTVGFDCTSANRTANLPDATTCGGRIYVIYQFGGGSTTGVTIDGNGAQTINGSATYVLQGYCDYSSVMIQSDGSNWVIISDALQTGCL